MTGTGRRRGRSVRARGAVGCLDDLIRFCEAGRYSGRARRDDERGALISVTEREELAAVIAPLTALISI